MHSRRFVGVHCMAYGRVMNHDTKTGSFSKLLFNALVLCVGIFASARSFYSLCVLLPAAAAAVNPRALVLKMLIDIFLDLRPVRTRVEFFISARKRTVSCNTIITSNTNKPSACVCSSLSSCLTPQPQPSLVLSDTGYAKQVV